MKILIVQLSDIHFSKKHNPIDRRFEKLANAIRSKYESEQHKKLFLINNGDLTNRGCEDGFRKGKEFMENLTSRLTDLNAIWFAVPGNHDCDFNGSQTVRDKLLADIDANEIEPEILNLVLAPQTHYFETFKTIPSWHSVSQDSPFVFSITIELGSDQKVQVNLINTAWMSTKSEKPNSIKFPLNQLDDIPRGDHISISVMHHPTNWFAQPCTMRQFTEKVESFSDMILTGHEHCQRMITKSYDASDSERTTYLEGGVIQEESDPEISAFNAIVLDTVEETASVSKFLWTTDGFFEEVELNSENLSPNQRFVQTGRRRIKDSFKKVLESVDLPFAKSSVRSLDLKDLFVIPDLRARDRKSTQWNLFRSASLLDLVRDTEKLLFFGPEMCGKSCLAKFLFSSLHNDGATPLMLDGAKFKKTKIDFKNVVRRAINTQYSELKQAEFWQIDKSERILVVENLNRSLSNASCLKDFFMAAEGSFGKVIAFGGDEFWLFEADNNLDLDSYKRFEICEFGNVKIRELAANWYSSDNNDPDEKLDDRIENATKLLESVLSSEVIPQYPWIITALLQKAEVSDEIESKNGSFGELYRALMVAALGRTKSQLDIPGQMTYLSELAFWLFKSEQGTITQGELETFHLEHCKTFGLPLALTGTIEELVSCGVVGYEGDEYYFKAKFSFCFFLATYFARHIHKESIQRQIGEIAGNLAHTETANTLVFLAFLSDNPRVISRILTAVDDMYGETAMTDLCTDVAKISLLEIADVKVHLPDESPEEIRKQISESKDQSKLTNSKNETDGRDLSIPKSRAKRESALENVLAAVKAIQILGQLLRNGSGSMTIARKKRITTTVFKLSRRLLGECFAELQDVENELASFIRENFKQIEENEELAKSIDENLNRIFWLAYGVGSGVSNRVAQSVGLGLLIPTFKAVLDEDDCMPNRIFDFAIKLEHSKHLPVSEIIQIFTDVKSDIYLSSLVRMLVSRQLTIRNMRDSDYQRVCAALEISGGRKSNSQTLNPHQKRLGRTSTAK